ncbi:Putative Mob1 family protein [Penicillium brasilianum]|uniref:Putative Mob1 family protein n=1 Tax=Penicillium brasilianum TaxID=104259 RepID=A0A0F7TB87_PENBI|nr:Putative Mob1 family protein [Penicillium brasilianum]
MTAAGVSPSSSPRLPSPPPFTEVQIGPQSPSIGEAFGKDAEQLLGGAAHDDDGPTRRIRPGTKAADMAFGPPLIPLSQLDSPFQLQEHLKALYHHFTKPEGSDTVVPITRQVASQLATPPDGVDRSLWLYELCRFLTMKVNNLIIAFFAENPPCSAQTCPEMRASEWQYLCAVHDPPKSCCAIDYCCHTLDWATNTLTSPKYFPSRLTLGTEGSAGPQASMRHLTNIFRRLYRIFAHAWFQHRDVFWTVEGHDGLYVFFKTVCDMFALIPEDNYTIPLEAEGPDAIQPQPDVDEAVDNKRLTILRKENEGPFGSGVEGMDPAISTGATTRRHKHSPSTGSRVGTITESAEDNDESTQISAPLREVLQEEAQPEPTADPLAEETKDIPTERAAPTATEDSSKDASPFADPSAASELGQPAEEALTADETPKEAEADAQDSHSEAKPHETEDEARADDVTTTSAADNNEEPEQAAEAKPEAATEQKAES